MKRFTAWKQKLGAQAKFVVAAIILTVITVGIVIYFLTSLVATLTDVLRVESNPVPAKQFDTEGFEKLNLTK